MTNYLNFSYASTSTHILIGFALFFLAITQTILISNKNTKLRNYIFLVFFLTGILIFTLNFYYLGNFKLSLLKENFKNYHSLYSILGLSYSVLILSITYLMSENINKKEWSYLNMFFLFFLGGLLLFFSKGVNLELKKEILLEHIFIASPLILYPLFYILGEVKNSIKLKKISVILLFISSFGLLSYKERNDTFKPTITLNFQEEIKINETNINKKSNNIRPQLKNKK